MHDFTDSLKVEDQWAPVLNKWLVSTFGIKTLHTAKQGLQWQGVDRYFMFRDRTVTVEYKCDQLARTTGNAFIETLSNVESGRAGAIVSTRADWLAYFIVPSRVLMFRPDDLRNELDAWRRKYPERDVENAGYSTRGLLVPLLVLQRVAWDDAWISPAKGVPRTPRTISAGWQRKCRTAA